MSKVKFEVRFSVKAKVRIKMGIGVVSVLNMTVKGSYTRWD